MGTENLSELMTKHVDGKVLEHHVLIEVWSSTQALIALSSGEAEYYGVVRAVGIALGIQAFYNDLGLNLLIQA